MKKQYKLLVVDIDGTLLNSRGVISTEDTEAITRVKEKGVRVAVSTGRAAMAAGWVLDHLQLDGYHIFFDGALVFNPVKKREAYAESIEGDLAWQAVEFGRQSNLHIDLSSSTRYFIEKETWAVDIRRQFFRLEPTFADFAEVCKKERVIKATIITRTEAERARALDFQNQFRGRLAFSWTTTPAYPDVDFINVLSPKVSKGKALEELCARLNVSLDEVVAIGDGVNDVSLLKRVGLAVAMGNCVDELKSVAHTVTHDVDHSGVAEAINKFIV
ncbi:MAG: Cof-type HAD-IIB family hydrolase [Dehalococcoidia bacterium]|nr:Cof-type HAD-IIB family hydrolase [Dehalococcoidia bacterium]